MSGDDIAFVGFFVAWLCAPGVWWLMMKQKQWEWKLSCRRGFEVRRGK